jgi:hypothetical protein
MRSNVIPRTVAAIVFCAFSTGAWELGGQRARLMASPSWSKVTGNTGFQARDSCGEVVYDGKMWIMGGWFNSYAGPFPRDVWSSTDGAAWTRVTQEAPWLHGDLPTTMVFDNKMWIMGGWYNGRNPGASASNQVWCSTNGSDWTQTAAAAPWAARCGAGGAVFKNKMWIIGGTEQYYYGDDGSLLNDVWSSSDGVTWEPATLNAPWSPRAYHQVLAFDDKLWVLGGGSYTPGLWSLNDVWNSSDGVTWTKVAEHAPWDSRIWFSAEVYDDRMWILGGSTAGGTWLRNEVWSSGDGTTWTQLQTDAVWTPRHEMSTYVFQNKLWLVGGYDVAHLVNDVWRLDGVISGPIAVDDSYGVDEDTMLDVPAIGVLQNDTDPENDPLSARGVSEPSHGTLSLRNDGSFTYNPDPDFFGTDSFTYKASDLIDDSNVATVRIAVNPINDFPVAVDDEYSVDANGDLWTAHGVLENDYDVDGDHLTVDAGHPAHGTVTMYSDGSFHYAPEEGFWGIDHFTYALFDGVDDAGVDMATVQITVWTPGDANRDGFVDDKDASALGAHWLMSDATWEMGDFNGDHNVNDADAAILAAHWGEGTGEARVPEPGSLALLAGIAVMGMIYLRRRKA